MARKEFAPIWNGIDPLGDRLTFEVGRDPLRPRKWLIWRANIYGGAFETMRFASADEAKGWGDSLTRRRPVRWERIPRRCASCHREEEPTMRRSGFRKIRLNKDGICAVCVEVEAEVAFEARERARAEAQR